MIMDIVERSDRNIERAWRILSDKGIVSAWEGIGAEVHVVGSLRTALMMDNLDIDLHIYTDRIDPGDSFSVMQKLVDRLHFTEIVYRDLTATEEECLEWHASFTDEYGDPWKLDMIHIRRGSRYDGVVERVTDAIVAKLTPEIRRTVLSIKSSVPAGIVVPGIEIYRAVLSGGVGDYEQMRQWLDRNPIGNTLDWEP